MWTGEGEEETEKKKKKKEEEVNVDVRRLFLAGWVHGWCFFPLWDCCPAQD